MFVVDSKLVGDVEVRGVRGYQIEFVFLSLNGLVNLEAWF